VPCSLAWRRRTSLSASPGLYSTALLTALQASRLSARRLWWAHDPNTTIGVAMAAPAGLDGVAGLPSGAHLRVKLGVETERAMRAKEGRIARCEHSPGSWASC
jgi:hypothetical protein